MKCFKWFIWVLIFGVFAYWGSTFVERYFPKKNLVDISDVSLGIVHPGSNVDFFVTIYNRTFREIPLKPIKTSCGCLAPDHEKPVVLLPGANVLSFVFTAPDSPEKFKQDIWFFAENGTPSAWVVKIDGEVAADVWAAPSRLTLQCDGSSITPTATFVLHSIGRNIRTTITSPDALQCHLIQRNGDRHVFSITCDDELSNDVQKKGKITGSVFFEFEETTPGHLEVPIDFVSKPKFTVNPTFIEFSHDLRSEQPLLHKIAIKKLADHLPFDRLQVTLVAPWVRLVDTRESGTYIFLTFEFFPKQMPIYERAVYARLTFTDLPNHNQVECRCILK